MYGTIFRMKVKPGQEQRLVEVFEEWDRERKPNIQGAVASLLLRTDKQPGEFIGVAVFKDKATYVANANDPEQDKWFRKLQELLETDPVWEDGEYITADVG